MNPLLKRLTGSIPATAATELRREWASFVIHQNVCPVPAPDLAAEGAYWQRGCQLLLLDIRGRPTHFCKLRPAGDQNTAHEGNVLVRLASFDELRDSIPAAHWATDSGAQILITAFATERPYLPRLQTIDAATWGSDMRALLTVNRRLSAYGAVAFQEQAGRAGAFCHGTEVSGSLDSLSAEGLAAADIRLLKDFLDQVQPCGRSPQHGDLWPGNILHATGRWRIVDFEMFGTIHAPLFDALHLLRTCLDARTGADLQPWIGRLGTGSADAEVSLGLMREQAISFGLGFDGLLACLVHYLATMAHRFVRAELPAQVSAPLLEDLGVIAAGLRAGKPGPAALASITW